MRILTEHGLDKRCFFDLEPSGVVTVVHGNSTSLGTLDEIEDLEARSGLCIVISGTSEGKPDPNVWSYPVVEYKDLRLCIFRTSIYKGYLCEQKSANTEMSEHSASVEVALTPPEGLVKQNVALPGPLDQVDVNLLEKAIPRLGTTSQVGGTVIWKGNKTFPIIWPRRQVTPHRPWVTEVGEPYMAAAPDPRENPNKGVSHDSSSTAIR